MREGTAGGLAGRRSDDRSASPRGSVAKANRLESLDLIYPRGKLGGITLSLPMKRPLLFALPIAAAALVAAYLLWPRGSDRKPSSEPAAGPTAPAPRGPRAKEAGPRTPTAPDPRDLGVLQDDDPVGTLRLEGLVLGADEQ